MKTGNDGFARKIAEQLEKSANDLDSHTRMRLRGIGGAFVNEQIAQAHIGVARIGTK